MNISEDSTACTFTDFEQLADGATSYRIKNKLSKIIFVDDLYYLGLLFLENGYLFKILKSDAYKSVSSYEEPLKSLYLRLIDGLDVSARQAFINAVSTVREK